MGTAGQRSRVRVGVLGLGRVGSWHAATLAHLPEADLRVVSDVDPVLCNRVAAELAAKACPDPLAAVADPDLDAVLICTPSATHADLVAAAARAGAAIFCEKPLATTSAAARAAVAAAAAAGVPLQVGFNRRFDDGFAALRRQVVSGAVGRPLVVKSTSRDPELSSMAYLRHAGGIFLDQMIHDIDAVRFLTGQEAVSVYASGSALLEPQLAEFGDVDTAVLHVRFDGGCLGIIDTSRQCGYGHQIEAEIYGSSGCARLDLQKAEPLLIYDARSGPGFRLPHWFLERFAAAYRAEMAAFVTAVRDGSPPLCDGRDGLHAILIAEAAGRSLRSGAPEAVRYGDDNGSGE